MKSYAKLQELMETLAAEGHDDRALASLEIVIVGFVCGMRASTQREMEKALDAERVGTYNSSLKKGNCP